MALDEKLPKQLTEIIEKLEAHGYKAYIYGKCVRELLKGQTILDFDMLTDARPARIRAIFDMDMPDSENAEQEILVRVLGIAASIKTYTDLKSELARAAALTIDSLAYNPKTGFADFFGGLKHSEDGVIAFIDNTPESVNGADILPTLALYAEADYKIAAETKEAILANREKAVFVRDEFEQVLMGKRSGEVFNEYSQVFKAVIPELAMFGDFPALLANAFKSIGCSSPIKNLRYALFFREFGKPDCHSADPNGKASFFGHTERARIYADRLMRRWGCSDEDRQEVGFIIENREKTAEANEKNIREFDIPSELLKRLLLFHCAVIRAEDPRNERDSMRYKRLAGLII